MIRSIKSPLGILLSKEFERADQILMVIGADTDIFLLDYAQRLIHNNDSRVQLLDLFGIVNGNPEIKEAIRAMEQFSPQHVALFADPKSLGRNGLNDLLICSLISWPLLTNHAPTLLDEANSVLLMRPALWR